MILIDKFFQFSNEERVLIYQMGKVGSTSLEKSIPESIHLHTLFDNSPCYVHQAQKMRNIQGKLKNKIYSYLRRVAIKRRNEIRIISLIRNPYDRDISMFFQDLPHWLYEYIGEQNVDTKRENCGFLSDAFNQVYDNKYALDWFDKEIKRFTGIDVYAEKFDNEKGFELYEKGKCKLLLVELSKLGQCEKVISDFVGRNIKLNASNKAENKWYSQLYSDFKLKHVFTEKYEMELQNSKFWVKFFKDDKRRYNKIHS